MYLVSYRTKRVFQFINTQSQLPLDSIYSCRCAVGQGTTVSLLPSMTWLRLYSVTRFGVCRISDEPISASARVLQMVSQFRNLNKRSSRYRYFFFDNKYATMSAEKDVGS